jgi:hypothetical protein
MNEKSIDTIVEQPEDSAPVNEQGGFYFSSAIKIHDPETQEVLVQMRGDN